MPAHRAFRLLVPGLALCLVFAAPLGAQSQVIDRFLERVSSAPGAAREALIDSFLNVHPATPLFECDSSAILFYRGPDSSVSYAGDQNGWDPSAAPFTRLDATDFWYRREKLEPDARLDYKLVLGGRVWILDPRNPSVQMGGFGQNSELRMPRRPVVVETRRDPAIAHGTFLDTSLASGLLANRRPVRVYLPAGYESSPDSFRVILFHDGLDYLTLGEADNTLDNLIARRRIPPAIGVFVPAVDSVRHSEYASTRMTAFAAFIGGDVMGWVDRRFRTMKRPAMRAVVGASDGGNISLYLALRYSGVFGNVCAQSSNVTDSVRDGFAGGPRLDLRIWLDVGTYDIPLLIPRVRGLAAVLRQKGYDFRFREVHEGHSWGNWKGHLGEALEYFFREPASQR